MNENETLRARIAELEAQLAEARGILAQMADPDDCHYDHHGFCQAHGWLYNEQCPHSRAKHFLATTESEGE